MTSLPRVADVQMPPMGTAHGGVFSIGDKVAAEGPMAWVHGEVVAVYGNYVKVEYELNGRKLYALILSWRLKKI